MFEIKQYTWRIIIVLTADAIFYLVILSFALKNWFHTD